ncbi:MAG: YlbF family regulator [Romboutsia sp.]|uniref:YlbF family regulator n=1 Tax=Romboutsia sp. TaxID=1965302 RepID=UPI003F2AC285
MDINQKAKEFAHYVKSTDEFKNMHRNKSDLEKNRTLKRQLDSYVNKKNNIYSSYRMEDASKKISQLNRDYHDFFNLPLVSNYMQSTREFNSLMEKLYKSIENELVK